MSDLMRPALRRLPPHHRSGQGRQPPKSEIYEWRLALREQRQVRDRPRAADIGDGDIW